MMIKFIEKEATCDVFDHTLTNLLNFLVSYTDLTYDFEEEFKREEQDEER